MRPRHWDLLRPARCLLALPFVLLACAAADAPRPRAAPPAPLGCTPDELEASDARARVAREEHCAQDHWLGRMGIPCTAAMRYYSARSVAALSECTDGLFAAPPPGVAPAELARRAGHDCTDHLLRTPPPAPCARRILARAVCERAQRCGRGAMVPGCAERGEAALHPAVAGTVGLWNSAGQAALAECIGALPCGSDPRRTSQVDCLAFTSTGGT
jgi:hypothetical protein